jgi:hypothetical protein
MEASQQEQAELLAFLDINRDLFAWLSSDLVGVSRDVVQHQLQVSQTARPMKQKHRKMSEEKASHKG